MVKDGHPSLENLASTSDPKDGVVKGVVPNLHTTWSKGGHPSLEKLTRASDHSNSYF